MSVFSKKPVEPPAKSGYDHGLSRGQVSPEGQKEGEGEAPKTYRAGNMMELVKDLAENTGMQGVANIKRAHSIVRRIFWMAVVIAGVSECCKCNVCTNYIIL